MTCFGTVAVPTSPRRVMLFVSVSPPGAALDMERLETVMLRTRAGRTTRRSCAEEPLAQRFCGALSSPRQRANRGT
jgi:hypothetical protein